MIASDVMDKVASVCLNDSSKSVYTYDKQLPLLQVAYSELGKFYRQNNLAMTNELSTIVEITTSMRDWGGTTGPALPTDLISIQKIGERDFGSTEDFIEMKRCEFLPMTQILTNQLIFWAWQGQVVKFLGANTNRDVQMQYIGDSFSAITSAGSTINVKDCDNFLMFRTAGLCARFIGENPTRADALDVDATVALDQLLNMGTKERQVMPVRRRPFMANYKSIGRY